MNNNSLPDIKECSIAVIGLGYVGLPLALEIAKRDFCFLTKEKIFRKVIGFDINIERIEQLKKGLDRNNIYSKENLKVIKNIKYSNDIELIKNCDVFIITVPTPINENNEPDLNYLKDASILVGNAIKNNKKNQIVIFESTVYPGATEEFCIPLIENISNKKYNNKEYKNSFYGGYSTERINPGDTKHTIETVIKITSGSNKDVSYWIDNFYKSFIKAGTFNVSSIKVAEAAKIIENTQRDINIALVNELSIIFKKMGIDFNEILNAANTKWNFQKYRPGLVGGHCIGVDPYYLTFKAKKIGLNPNLILAGRKINDGMHEYLLSQIISKISQRSERIKIEKVLILGISYKENCSDSRNSQLINLVKNMLAINMNITIVDPLVNPKSVFEKTGLKLLKNIPKNKKYSLIIFALDHLQFKKINYKELKNLSYSNTIIIDLTNRIVGEDIYHL